MLDDNIIFYGRCAINYDVSMEEEVITGTPSVAAHFTARVVYIFIYKQGQMKNK